MSTKIKNTKIDTDYFNFENDEFYDWASEIQMLPYAEMFPGMSEEDFAALVANRQEVEMEELIDANEGNILNRCDPFTNGTAAGITKCILPAQGKSSAVIYDIFDAGFGPGAYPIDTLEPLIRDAEGVFVWSGEPSSKRCHKVLCAAILHGVAVAVHTIPKHAPSWRHTFARTVRTGSSGQ
jgi:hypothetical protein